LRGRFYGVFFEPSNNTFSNAASPKKLPYSSAYSPTPSCSFARDLVQVVFDSASFPVDEPLVESPHLNAVRVCGEPCLHAHLPVLICPGTLPADVAHTVPGGVFRQLLDVFAVCDLDPLPVLPTAYVPVLEAAVLSWCEVEALSAAS